MQHSKFHLKMHLTLLSISCIFLGTPVLAQSSGYQSSEAKVLKTENGRYVFGQISQLARDQYLLDTKTGRLWQVVVDTVGNNKLQPVPFIQLFGDELYTPDAESEVEGYKKAVRQNLIDKLKVSVDSTKTKRK